MRRSVRLTAVMVLLAAAALWGQANVAARMAEAEKLQSSGRTADAQRAYEALLPSLRSGGASAELGSALTALSQIASSSGDYDRAIALATEATDVFHRLQDTAGEARGWNNRGVAHLFRGDYPQAAGEFEKAIALAQQSGSGKTEVQALNNRGVVSFYQARYFDSLEWYGKARRRLAAAPGADWYANWWQITLFNEATMYQKLGNDQHALEVYRDLERHFQDLTPSDRAHVKANLGVVYRRLGDPDKALNAYREAQVLYRRERDADGELGVLKNIGIVQALDLQRLDDAVKTFDVALALAGRSRNRRELLQARLYRGETLLRLRRIEPAEREFRLALDLAQTLNAPEETWKAQYGVGSIAEARGNTAAAETGYRQAIATVESVRAGLPLAALKQDFFGDKRIVYDALIRLLLAKHDVAGMFEFLERSRARNFQDLLQQRLNTGVSVSLPAVQQRLSENTMLLEYWSTADRIAAVWVTHRSFGVFTVADSHAEVESVAKAARQLPTVGADWRGRMSPLLRGLLADIEPFRQPSLQHLIVVPDGFLASLPLEAAVLPGGTQLAIERYDVTYAPSALLLFRQSSAAQQAWYWPWQEQLAAFGDPVVAAAPQGAAAMQPSLPESSTELTDLARMSYGKALLYVGGADQKQAFLAAATRRPALLHISTHAVADFEVPERSRLLFSPAAPGAANEYVFLRELYDANFTGVEVATLSACDTEAGRLVRGEGVQAFSRALLSRGARSAVTTLWRVDDHATAEFMKQFYYFLLVRRETRAAALRSAKLAFLSSGTDFVTPRYWAAFVLNGEGSTPVPRFFGWPVLLATMALAGAIAALAVRLARR